MIRLEKIRDIAPSISQVWVDRYVSLNFRSYEDTLGDAQYIYIGDRKTSLLEFQVAPGTTTIRGFTLISFNALHVPEPLDNVVEHGDCQSSHFLRP